MGKSILGEQIIICAKQALHKQLVSKMIICAKFYSLFWEVCEPQSKENDFLGNFAQIRNAFDMI